MARTSKSKKPQLSAAGLFDNGPKRKPEARRRREQLASVMLDSLRDVPTFPKDFSSWVRLIDLEHEALPKEYHEPEDPEWAWLAIGRTFNRQERDILWHKAIEQRMNEFAPWVVQLMERLWERGMEGDTQAAKEFMNRIVGQSTQLVQVQHSASSDLQNLLGELKPQQAYERPQIDDSGQEIIEVEALPQEASNEQEEND